TQRGDGEREAQVGIERLAVRRGSHEVVDAGLRLATLDVEVDAHHLRRHVARQEDGEVRGAAAGESTGLPARGNHIGQPGAGQRGDVGAGEARARHAAPVLAAAFAGGERQRDRAEVGHVVGLEAARADHRNRRTRRRGGLHGVGVPVHVDRHVLVRTEQQVGARARRIRRAATAAGTGAATAATATARPATTGGTTAGARALRSPWFARAAGAATTRARTAATGSGATAAARALRSPGLARTAGTVAGGRIVALRPP